MEFNVGDKVRIKSDLSLSSKLDVIQNMLAFRGMETIITNIHSFDGGEAYKLLVDGAFYYWFDGTLESIVEIEVKNISNFEREIIKHIPKEYSYMARDENDLIYLYTEKPTKGYSVWLVTGKNQSEELVLTDVFENIKWEDSEPWKFKTEDSNEL